MSVEKIISDWSKGKYQPLYWLEGEEEYFIDQVVDYAEHHILNESESSFNLSIFYGKDANWADVINACRRYPMFSERQVVLLKEAQQMKDVEKLEPYVENPSPTTVFVVSYKDKKLDARKKFSKTVKEKGVLVTTRKLQERQLPEWITDLLHSKGLTITQKALAILVDHVGNDLSRIDNEIGKMTINMGKRTQITEEDIETNIGVSKEFNVFELQKALAGKDLSSAMRIIQYFEANPKAAPIQMILPALYGFFSKVFMSFGAGNDEKAVAASLGVPPFFVKDYLRAASLYSYPGVERALLLLHHYNLRSLGVGDAGTEDASLLKEMVVRMVAAD
jgi:DNA polymerase III subunit delta